MKSWDQIELQNAKIIQKCDLFFLGGGRRKFRHQKVRRQKFRRKKFRRISKSRNFVVRKFVVRNFVVLIRITAFTKRYTIT